MSDWKTIEKEFDEELCDPDGIVYQNHEDILSFFKERCVPREEIINKCSFCGIPTNHRGECLNGACAHN